MKGLASKVRKAINQYRSTIHIKKRDVLASSRAAVDRVSTNASTVEPEITNNSDAQDKVDQQNVFCLVTIGVKDHRGDH